MQRLPVGGGTTAKPEQPREAARVEKLGPVAVLRFDRAERLNPLGLQGDAEVIRGLLEDLANDPDTRVLVVTGEGKAFSAGGDLKAMHNGSLSGPAPEIMAIYRARIQRMTEALAAFEWPIIAAINGPAIGLGCGIALHADIRVASDKAKLAMPFVNLGLIPGDGSVQRLVELVGYEHAARLLLTGETVDAAAAMRMGLVSEVVPAADLLGHALALAESIASKPPLALRATKLLLRSARDGGSSAIGDLSIALQSILHQTPEFRSSVQALVDRMESGSTAS